MTKGTDKSPDITLYGKTLRWVMTSVAEVC